MINEQALDPFTEDKTTGRAFLTWRLILSLSFISAFWAGLVHGQRFYCLLDEKPKNLNLEAKSYEAGGSFNREQSRGFCCDAAIHWPYLYCDHLAGFSGYFDSEPV